ncbi:MAG: hypothetical protein LIO43_02555 [Clostridiales bacterium]|nr:hypothetical protein [Clostridiales bacterium]
MFYDFVHQCLNCYTYLSKNTYPALNRILPMSLLGVFSLLCSIYYFFGCLAFSSSKYNFNELKFFHFVPVLWAVCGICLGFTEYDDGLYAEETILKYTVLFLPFCFSSFLPAPLIPAENG